MAVGTVGEPGKGKRLVIPTLVVSSAELATSEVQVEGDAYRHLFRARRLAVGDFLRLVDGRGCAREGRVEAVDRRSARISVGTAAPSLEPPVHLTLWVAVPKLDRASWLVEKATELGVARVAFVQFARSSRDLDEGQLERLNRIARAAVGQCGRSVVPEVSTPRRLDEAVAEMGPNVYRLDPRATSGGFPRNLNRVDLVIGPEGGLEDEECQRMASSSMVPVNLGDRILRIETAALAGAAILLCGGAPGSPSR